MKNLQLGSEGGQKPRSLAFGVTFSQDGRFAKRLSGVSISLARLVKQRLRSRALRRERAGRTPPWYKLGEQDSAVRA